MTTGGVPLTSEWATRTQAGDSKVVVELIGATFIHKVGTARWNSWTSTEYLVDNSKYADQNKISQSVSS